MATLENAGGAFGYIAPTKNAKGNPMAKNPKQPIEKIDVVAEAAGWRRAVR